MRPKVIFTNVTKKLSLYREQSEKRRNVFSLRKKDKSYFSPVKNLSFTILEGETIGIVGLNGSGKSTLCQLLAEVVSPTSGTIEIRGKTSLVSNSAGFNCHLSGIENIELMCLIYGYTNEETAALQENIVAFADLGEYIYLPVKRYSSGMKSRLSFALAAYINPDIIIIDEALSVGDPAFYDKCVRKINQLKNEGATIMILSHSLTQIEELCDRVIWMNFGRVERIDQTKTVLAEYHTFVQWFNGLSDFHKDIYQTEIEFEQMNRDTEPQSEKTQLSTFDFSFRKYMYVMLVCIILSGAALFGLTPTKLSGFFFAKDTERPGDYNRFENDIDSKGLVLAEEADIYSNKCLKDFIGTADYMDELYVEKQIGAVYQIQIDSMEGYISEEDILLIKDTLPKFDLEPADFLAVFPETFSDAYVYFFSFMGMKADAMKASIPEAAIVTDSSIHYADYDVCYAVNSQNVINGISIGNTVISDKKLNEMVKSGALQGTSFYYFQINDFKVLYDLTSKEITFIPESADNRKA